MKKILFYLTLIFSTTFYAQKIEKENTYEGEELCKILDKMNEKDQEKRKLMPQDPFFKALDSLIKSKGITTKEYSKLPQSEMLENGKKIRKIVGKFPTDIQKRKIDSLMTLQIAIDNENTELLIDIIEKRGYPNKNNCECKKIPIVFRHSQEKYWDKIRVLIEKEHKAKRLDDFNYKLFLNHINGRKTFSID